MQTFNKRVGGLLQFHERFYRLKRELFLPASQTRR